ncbi:MAG: sulfatase family protein [Spirochaetota bacterium]
MKPTPKPNIVYILADDMGYGDVSCMNEASKIRTPHIDALAAAGMRFTDAHASSAVCTPSRYSILTGRYAWRSELKEGVIWGYSPHLIEDGRTTVASFLREQGYATACVGKWHLGMDWQDASGEPTEDPERVDFSRPVRNGPTSFGFDSFFGISASLDMAPYVYIEDDHVTELPNRRTEYAEPTTFWRDGPTGKDFFHIDVLPTLARRASEYVRGHGRDSERPWFLYFPLPAPHTPILPTAEFRGVSGTNAYGDFCVQVDAVVGEIVRAVEESGQADDTIVVFTSDNGCSPNANFDELAALGHHPSYHFRGHKADIYDGGHRVPLVVRWPGVVPADRRCDEIVCLGDLFATLADHLGAPLPDNVAEDSVSTLPLLRGGTEPVREAIVHHSIDGSFSIREGRWKLELCPGSGGWSWPQPGEEPDGAPPIQLYDMEADVGERKNVYDKPPELVERLTELLSRYVREGRSTPGVPQENTGPRRWPQLHWLSEPGES